MHIHVRTYVHVRMCVHMHMQGEIELDYQCIVIVCMFARQLQLSGVYVSNSKCDVPQSNFVKLKTVVNCVPVTLNTLIIAMKQEVISSITGTFH